MARRGLLLARQVRQARGCGRHRVRWSPRRRTRPARSRRPKIGVYAAVAWRLQWCETMQPSLVTSSDCAGAATSFGSSVGVGAAAAAGGSTTAGGVAADAVFNASLIIVSWPGRPNRRTIDALLVDPARGHSNDGPLRVEERATAVACTSTPSSRTHWPGPRMGSFRRSWPCTRWKPARRWSPSRPCGW